MDLRKMHTWWQIWLLWLEYILIICPKNIDGQINEGTGGKAATGNANAPLHIKAEGWKLPSLCSGKGNYELFGFTHYVPGSGRSTGTFSVKEM